MGILPMNEHGRNGHATSHDKDRPQALACPHRFSRTGAT